MTNIVDTVKRTSLWVDDFESEQPTQRTISSVFNSAIGEIGELSVEVNIANGHPYKQPGKDGVVGEAIDVIICMLDLIHVANPSFTQEQLEQYVVEKCNKWVQSEETKLINYYNSVGTK